MSAGSAPLRIAMVAGEASGDQLGAALIAALRDGGPVEVFGVAGPRMIAAGCQSLAAADELAVMGLAEVVRHLPRLLRLRAQLLERIRAAAPDVFVGIDAPEFNLGLARRLKARGLHTVQYVSPQVWAWRQGRARRIHESCDLVLCLLPFETAFYERWGVRSVFVGHPLADAIPFEPDRAAARAQLGLGSGERVIALLPGSRLGEIEHLAAPFVAAARSIAASRPGTRFIAPMASQAARATFERHLDAVHPRPPVQLVDGGSQLALAAADGVLVASGTATLETLLSGRPMVAAYRVNPLTAAIVRRLRLVKVPFFSQPNLLVGRALVPEFLQEAVRGEALAAALLREMEDPAHVEMLRREFRAVHERLRVGGARRAATAIRELLAAPGTGA